MFSDLLIELSFDQVLTVNLEIGQNALKSVFFCLPSVKHLKKYEKGGFLTTFINMYDMGKYQCMTWACDSLK